jgi:bis(5'-nucleosyl)-tetraphosphatase (symmetrical)
MARFAIGDIQGCAEELRLLLKRISFNADRDRLWFVGDLVNRGPRSLDVLRDVRALADNAIVVLGNHDLHLLALAFGAKTRNKSGDTLAEVLAAPDRDLLLEWLLHRPLAHWDEEHGDLLVHAGVVPQWTCRMTVSLAHEVEDVLRRDPRLLLTRMYGDEPDRWSDELAGIERWRFIVNVLTRLRMCTTEGRVELKVKGTPEESLWPLRPWFEITRRQTAGCRVVFGHWSALGFVSSHNVLGLDTGCVWGGALTAVNLDAEPSPQSIPCAGYQTPGPH